MSPVVALAKSFNTVAAIAPASLTATSTSPKLTSCASSKAACASAAVPVIAVTDAEVTDPDVSLSKPVSDVAATEPASLNVKL